MSEVQSRPSSRTVPGSASRSTPPELEYDGQDTPVLIQLPDISPVVESPSPAPSSVVAPAVPDQQRVIPGGLRTNPWRIPRRPLPTSRFLPPAWDQAELRVKLMVVAGLFFVLGSTYVLLHGGGENEPTPDRWSQAAAPEPAPSDATEIAQQQPPIPTASVDLWPGDRAFSDSPVSANREVRPRASGPTLAAPALRPPGEPQDPWPNAPQLTPSGGSMEIDETPVSWPDPATTTPAASDPSGIEGWPDGDAILNPAGSAGRSWSPSSEAALMSSGPRPMEAGLPRVGSPPARGNHFQEPHGPSTARLDGKIEFPNVASPYEQRTSQLR